MFSGEFPPLADHHRKYLNESAISNEVINRLGISSNDALDSIVFPFSDGEHTILVHRPDHPQTKSKYHWPHDTSNILWSIQDGPGPTIIVEGIKQGLAIASWVSKEYSIYIMNGCYGWRNKRSPIGTVDLNFVDKKIIYVSFDTDRNTNSQVLMASKEIKSVLLQRGAIRVYFINWPGTGDEGPDDLLAMISSEKRQEWLNKYIKAAVTNLASYDPKRILEITSAEFDQPKKRIWLWENRIPLGRFVLLAGYEGTAKSTLATYIMAQVTKGILEGHFSMAPKSVIYITAEEDWYEDVMPRLITAGADLSRVHRVFVRHESGEESNISLSTDASGLQELIENNDVTLVIVDSLLYFIGETTEIDNAKSVNDILLPLIRIGMDTKCTFLGILHFNKNSKPANVLDKIANSKAFARLARSVLLTAKHEDHFILSTEKVLATDSLRFRLVNTALPPEWDDPEYGTIFAPVIEFEGTADLDVSDIVAAHSSNQTPEQVSDSVIWLRTYMEMCLGEAPALTIREVGRKEGFTPTMLNTAKIKLHIKSSRTRRDGIGHWMWKYDDKTIAEIKNRKKKELSI